MEGKTLDSKKKKKKYVRCSGFNQQVNIIEMQSGIEAEIFE